jgi:hypothetical protein
VKNFCGDTAETSGANDTAKNGLIQLYGLSEPVIRGIYCSKQLTWLTHEELCILDSSSYVN